MSSEDVVERNESNEEASTSDIPARFIDFDPETVAETDRVKEILAAHAAKPLSDYLANKYLWVSSHHKAETPFEWQIKEAPKHWDNFYKRNTTNFFKDRHWTTREFPELVETEGERKVHLEVGCGVGNFVWPLLEENKNIFVYACDFAKKAIELVKSHERYDETRCNAFVCDLTADSLDQTIPPNSVDSVSSVFCLSAIPPEKLQQAVANIAGVVKPGGVVLLRDYGIMDQAELRFKPGRMIRPHFYARQDGTFSVYFSLQQLQAMFEEAGFDVEENKYVTKEIENRKLELHDAQLDYYGKRLATCSSDRTIRIFDVEPEGHKLASVLEGHEGPVWQVAWAHPKFGNVLASCSYDTRVFIWRELDGQWVKAKEHLGHSSSGMIQFKIDLCCFEGADFRETLVNSLAWAPHEQGLVLATGSSDGKISVLTYKEDGTWDAATINAHSIGVNSVSWAPSAIPGSLISTSGGSNITAPKRLVSGGCDNLIKIWKEDNGTFKEEVALEGHTDWVRDVSWAPNIGLPGNYIASCSQDKTVLIWTQDAAGGAWSKKPLQKEAFPDVVWRVSWSTAGNILAVSCGDNKITLWKENLDGEYGQVGDVSEAS
ncbi:GTPase-activating protein S13 [Phlyctochytrium planicorne]|nr:GTPase-activating protein S13 [Phlyctochytrium planicorne]